MSFNGAIDFDVGKSQNTLMEFDNFIEFYLIIGVVVVVVGRKFCILFY